MARLSVVGNINLETTVRVEAFPVPYQPTTFTPFGVSSAVLTNIAYSKPLIAVARARGVPIATDLHTLTDIDDAYNAPFLQSAHILFVSGERISVPPAAWAEALLAASPAEVVVVGLGGQGAYLAVRSSGLRCLLPAVFTRPVLQTGGAGDALFACFLHGYLRSRDPLRALRAATVFASYKLGAANSGDGFLSHDALEALLVSLPEAE